VQVRCDLYVVTFTPSLIKSVIGSKFITEDMDMTVIKINFSVENE